MSDTKSNSNDEAKKSKKVKNATKSVEDSKSTPINLTPSQLNYAAIRSIVWGFADLVRDKGNGTVEDYSKVVLPTTVLKRIMDLQQEYVQGEGASAFELVSMGISSIDQVICDINAKSYKFFTLQEIAKNPAILLLTWEHLMAYKDNLNGSSVSIDTGYGLKYVTEAETFADLMFEYIRALNPVIQYVFNTFEFEQKILQKAILPFADYSKCCHDELTKYKFSNELISFDLFSELYMDLIGRFAHDSGKKGGEFFTPTALVKNSWRFLDLDSVANQLVSKERTSIAIGDPTSGSNTFLIYGYDDIIQRGNTIKPGAITRDNFFFYGQEKGGYQYCLGLINMIFHNVHTRYNVGIGQTVLDNIACTNANVIDKYSTGIGTQKGKLDFVVANPPYGLKDYGYEYANSNKATDSRWAKGVPLKSEGEYAFLMTIYDLLNEQGKAVVVMPLGTLFRGGSAGIREKLLAEDVVEGLVVLPKNMFLTTSIPVALWILNKNKNEADKGKVFMVNASEDFIKVGKFNEWQPDKSVDSYLSRATVEDYCGYVSFDTLQKNKFNLSVQRYYAKVKEAEEIDFLENEKEIARLEEDLFSKRQAMAPLLAQLSVLELTNKDEGSTTDANLAISDDTDSQQ